MKILSKMIALSASVVVAGVLADCAPMNPNGLRTDPGRSGRFTVALPYEQVYENERRGFLACLTGAYYQMTFAIRPRIFPAKQTASIVLVHHAGWDDIWAVVDIFSSDAGSTVRAYTTNHPLMKSFVSAAHNWALGNTRCQGPSITTNQFPLSE